MKEQLSVNSNSMRLYSTNSPDKFVSLKEAVLKGLPDDNGLFMPESIPELPKSFIENLKDYSFQEIAFEICKNLFQGYIPESDLQEIINKSVTFPAPVVKLDESKYILELFHGPTLAFKDFGARFMANLMSYFNQGEDTELVILVATSGDTGGAVASGFYQTEGIKVVILYPSGKVSPLQEKQLTTLGHNISAIEIDGTFDDCQALVKKAFLDKELCKQVRLSSANSINIARLIPQSFYYFEAYKQLQLQGKEVSFCIPSGNFGNLTAGILAKKMGLPVKHFIAATNDNDIVPAYLATGKYEPKVSVPTISNAMDVGSPSNFVRMSHLFGSTWSIIKENVKGYAYNDDDTKLGLKEVSDKYSYIIDPHGAVGYNALKDYQAVFSDSLGVILETAHPSKFIKDVEDVLKRDIDIPERLACLADKEKVADYMQPDYPSFKDHLLAKF